MEDYSTDGTQDEEEANEYSPERSDSEREADQTEVDRFLAEIQNAENCCRVRGKFGLILRVPNITPARAQKKEQVPFGRLVHTGYRSQAGKTVHQRIQAQRT
jgi:hypothetical protein